MPCGSQDLVTTIMPRSLCRPSYSSALPFPPSQAVRPLPSSRSMIDDVATTLQLGSVCATVLRRVRMQCTLEVML